MKRAVKDHLLYFAGFRSDLVKHHRTIDAVLTLSWIWLATRFWLRSDGIGFTLSVVNILFRGKRTIEKEQ